MALGEHAQSYSEALSGKGPVSPLAWQSLESVLARMDACSHDLSDRTLSPKARAFYRRQNAIIQSMHAAVAVSGVSGDGTCNHGDRNGHGYWRRCFASSSGAANLSLGANIALTIVKARELASCFYD